MRPYKKFPMSNEAILKLINEVKIRECLWNPDHENYNDRFHIITAWREISKLMELKAHTCRERWKRLRDNYRRAKKLRKSKISQGCKDMRTPKFENNLSFLTPHINHDDEVLSNTPPPTDFQDSGNDDGNLLEEAQSSHGSSAGFYVQAQYKANKRASVSSEPSPANSLYQEYLEKKYSEPKPKPDTILDFFVNLGETVKNFPEDVQIRVKRETFQIISDAEELVYKNKSRNFVEVKQEYLQNDFVPGLHTHDVQSREGQLDEGELNRRIKDENTIDISPSEFLD